MKFRNFSFLVAIFLTALISGCTNPTGTCTTGCSDDDPVIEKEGPGQITEGATACSVIGEETGMITVFVENGHEAIWLENEEGEEVPDTRYEDNPQSNQEHTFSNIPAGSYYVVAEKNDKTSRSELITVDECEVEKIPPVARFDWEADELAVDFNGSESSDEDGTIEKYEWSFGDGSSGEGVTPDYTYDEPGTYEVTLKVTDNDGLTDSVTHEVTVKVEKTLSNEYAHEVNYNLNGKERMAVSSSNKRYELISYGELRPILTDQDPEVMSGEFFYYNEKGESEEDFSLEFVCGDESRKFSTEVIKDETNVDGWTSTKIDLDASMFKSKEFCSITAKSEGGGEVVFSTAGKSGVPGKMIFTWKVLVDGNMMKVSTTAFTFTTDIQ